MRKKLLFVAIMFILIFQIACSSNREPVYSGTIEGEEIPILAEVNGPIAKFFVDEGDQVKKGQLLAQIDDRLIKAQVKEAEAGVQAAKAALDEIKAGTRNQEIEKTLSLLEQNDAKIDNINVQLSKLTDLLQQRKATIEQIKAQLTSAKETESFHQEQLKKLEELYKNGATSENEVNLEREQLNRSSAAVRQIEAQLVEAESIYEMARKDQGTYRNQMKELEANKKMQQAQLSLQEEGATKHTVLKLVSQLDQEKAKEEQIQIQLEKTKVVAPEDSIVLRRNISAGEVVTANFQMFTLLEEKKRKVKVYVPEAKLNEVELGGAAEIKVDAYPDQVFKGKITFISNKSEFTPKNVQTPEERTKIVFEVVVEPTEGIDQLKPGMPADIRFPNKETEK
ncbi:MAG TPA: HlyD family efflux transporter periplasmic adaptor subunit [Bacillus bacterium]|nr:HlyD family efflux transporter periplasmic adaptor subunit [Bacillus sp. (in: firmicutes)]